MIAYYTARTEKPSKTDDVKLFLDHGAAMSYVAQDGNRGLNIYQFNVDDRCDSANFSMETILLLRENSDGTISFIASGNWVELHELMGIPFYVDFHDRMKSHFNVSHSYFRKHYQISFIGESPKEPLADDLKTSIDTIDSLVDTIEESVDTINDTINSSIETINSDLNSEDNLSVDVEEVYAPSDVEAVSVDEDVIDELFGDSQVIPSGQNKELDELKNLLL